MNKNNNLISFSHTVRVLFITCVGCDTKNAKDVFSIFFSNIDVTDSKEEALELFHNNRYDLIIAGLKLPEIEDGLDLIEQIRKVTKSLTILTIAPALSQTEFTKLIELSIDGFIIKPIEVKQFSDVIHKVIQKLKDKEELYTYRVSLENKVQEQIESLRQKDKILTQKSKMAAMGEMVDAIAHQWKHPLNNIKMNVEMTRYDFEDGNIDGTYVQNLSGKIIDQIEHMNTTLNEFRSFFRPDKETNPFMISSSIKKSLLLLQDELMQYTIQTNIDMVKDFQINGIENEFIHLLINFLHNSKDAFIENNIQNKTINLKATQKDNKGILEFTDNAGGIPKDIIDKIFTANFTSKEKSGGTGVGLYMSKKILEKYDATINVENFKDGVKFTLQFNLEDI